MGIGDVLCFFMRLSGVAQEERLRGVLILTPRFWRRQAGHTPGHLGNSRAVRRQTAVQASIGSEPSLWFAGKARPGKVNSVGLAI